MAGGAPLPGWVLCLGAWVPSWEEVGIIFPLTTPSNAEETHAHVDTVDGGSAAWRFLGNGVVKQ